MKKHTASGTCPLIPFKEYTKLMHEHYKKLKALRITNHVTELYDYSGPIMTPKRKGKK